MAIRDKLIKIQLLTVLAAILMLWLGCGSGDESIVEPDTSTGEPDSITATGSLKGTIERIEGVSVTVRVLQNGNAITSTAADTDGNYRIDNLEPGYLHG